jgi:LCP family protein required for cell wall assembly
VRRSTRIAGAVALLVITASGVGHAVVAGLDGAINRVDAFGDMQDRPGDTRGTNFLLVGTDGRNGLDPAEKKQYHLGGAPCHCTDTIMLVHLSQDRQRASVVSIPRDTYVQLPDVGPAAFHAAGKGSPSPTSAGGRPMVPTHPAKLNEAYADGGPQLTVATVEKLTGVHVDHYLEVDFVSFMKTVDALGGVPVCTAKPLKDSYSGLDLPAGTTTLNGGEALQYVRSRHIDADSDLGRMNRQQQFMAQVIHKITSTGTLTDPVRLERVARTVLGSVRADEELSPTDLISLARSMKGFTTKSSEFATVPLSDLSHNVPGVGSTVLWDKPAAGRLWAAIRADQPLAPHPAAATPSATPTRTPATAVPVAPSQISVRVQNASGVNGLAGSVQRALHATGFATDGLPTTADRHTTATVIQYDPRWDRSAKSLAAAVPGAKLVPVTGQGAVMRLVLGEDGRGRVVHPVAVRAAPARPAASAAPRSGDAPGC